MGASSPVVGAELLTIEEAGTPIPLYRAVAQLLLNKYGLSAVAFTLHWPPKSRRIAQL